MNDPDKVDIVIPCMDVYKAKIQSDRSIEKLKLSIVVRVYLYNRKLLETNGLQQHQ